MELIQELMQLEPKTLENAYRQTMKNLISMELTLTKGGAFLSKFDGHLHTSHSVVTMLQEMLKRQDILSVSNGTYRLIVEHVVKQMVEYHCGDIEHENQFPTLMR